MTIFTKIIDGELPGNFVWADELCVAFATIEPVEPGHVLIVPREAIDKYSDLEPDLFAHIAKVAQIIGKAQERAFNVPRAILSVLGFDVPHMHMHVIPAVEGTSKKFPAVKMVDAAELAEPMQKLRAALRETGYAEFVPAE